MALTRRQLLTQTAVGAGAFAVGNVSTLLAANPGGGGQLCRRPCARPGRRPRPARPVLLRDRLRGRRPPAPAAAPRPAATTAPAAFAGPGGGVRLVQNHEIGSSRANPTLAPPELTYDPKAKGGTTTLTLDRRNSGSTSTSAWPAPGATAPAA